MSRDVKGKATTAAKFVMIAPLPVAVSRVGCVLADAFPPPVDSAEEEKAMTAFHVMTGAGERYTRPVINKISIADVFDALRRGYR